LTEEEKRVRESANDPNGWRHWGPYLSERAWGTVREDYSPDGSAWDYFPHDHARSRAYRWNEDGMGGICDIRQRLCFAVALWNGQDPILKERLFGLTGPQGNHGEDPKEYYFYLDATPTASYLKFLYKYPQRAYPYEKLIAENRRRGRYEPEYELLDTGVFQDDRYWDVVIEYAKASPEDIAIRITAHNRGPDAAALHVLPTLWFRNRWSWGYNPNRPELRAESGRLIRAYHPQIGERYLLCGGGGESPELLFTENDTNNERLFRAPNSTPYVKDAFDRRVIHGETDAVNPARTGTKAAAWYQLEAPPGGSAEIRLTLSDLPPDAVADPLGAGFDNLFSTRIAEADEFYERLAPPDATGDMRCVQRQAFAGLIWSKQFYHFDVDHWLSGDPATPAPPPQRAQGRNRDWKHVSASDVLSMPDKWEYPWFAAWDLAFHMIPFAQIDPAFAKHQITLLCREWYMHPNGQLPAYEWALGDVNPPVHAWAALRVYEIEKQMRRDPDWPGDVDFLERIFHKLLLNFTWWVNRKDAQGNNIFEGGFLGLDNIGVFDRSAPLPTGGFIEQSDGTAWMAAYCLHLLAIALELARQDPTYEDVATKFAEHFIYIGHALTNIGPENDHLWDEEDGFFYDVLRLPGGEQIPLRLRSIVGLIPLLAVQLIDPETVGHVPDFRHRLRWFVSHKTHLAGSVVHPIGPDEDRRGIFSLLTPERLRRLLARMLDPEEFLSPYGIRALSRHHRDNPYLLNVDGHVYRVDYTPAESTTGLFGGNSNWRGPIWLPINYLLIEALHKYNAAYGPSFTVEYPTGSGQQHTLGEVAADLSRRLTHLFLRDENGRRPIYGGTETFQFDPHWRDHLLFHEYFHGDNGAGLGANHQTGWTALVATLLSQAQ
jgi:hypothetical protein